MLTISGHHSEELCEVYVHWQKFKSLLSLHSPALITTASRASYYSLKDFLNCLKFFVQCLYYYNSFQKLIGIGFIYLLSFCVMFSLEKELFAVICMVEVGEAVLRYSDLVFKIGFLHLKGKASNYFLQVFLLSKKFRL